MSEPRYIIGIDPAFSRDRTVLTIGRHNPASGRLEILDHLMPRQRAFFDATPKHRAITRRWNGAAR